MLLPSNINEMDSNSNSTLTAEASASETTTSDTAQLVANEASSSNYGQLNNHAEFQVILYSLLLSLKLSTIPSTYFNAIFVL